MISSSFPSFIKKMDFFASPVPSFYIDKRDTITTSVGAISSILILIVTFMFALIRFEILASRKNPNLTNYEETLLFGEPVNMQENGFMMAFAV